MMQEDKNYNICKQLASGDAICRRKVEYDWLIHKKVTSIINYYELTILDFGYILYWKCDSQLLAITVSTWKILLKLFWALKFALSSPFKKLEVF